MLTLFFTTNALAEDTSAPEKQVSTSADVSPLAKTVIFNSVAILPFKESDKSINLELTEVFQQALDDTKKYALVPQRKVQRWLHSRPKDSIDNTDAEKIYQAGKALVCRGIITGALSREKIIVKEKEKYRIDRVYRAVLEMTDIQTKNIVWSLTASTVQRPGASKNPVDHLKVPLKQGLQLLVKKMVEQGDIFSTRLPQPQVLSKQGKIRATRIVIQPEPPHIHLAYQLFRSSGKETYFTTVGSPQPNDKAPLTLDDSELKDDKTYYYSVIGFNQDGLASVPALPFPVTTTGPPATVSGFQATGNGLRQIHLSWEASQDPNVNGYTLYRSTEKNGPFETIASIAERDAQSYLDRGPAKNYEKYGKLQDNTTYYYSISSKNMVDVESPRSILVSAATKGAPIPPQNFIGTTGQPRRIPLSWDQSADPHVKGYAVYRAENKEGPFERIDFIHGKLTQEYIDNGDWNGPLKNNTIYYYKINAVNVVDIHSPESTTVAAITKPAPSTLPKVQALGGLFQRIEISWPHGKEQDITQYEVFRGNLAGEVSEKIAIVDSPTTAFLDTNLADGRTYWYSVRAIDRDRLKGEFSVPVSAITKPRPHRPENLKGKITGKKIILEWAKNREKDIVHYQVYSSGFLGTERGTTVENHFTLTEEVSPGEEYTFSVRAIDKDGLISDFSQPVTLKISKIPEK